MNVETIVIGPELAQRSLAENMRELWSFRGLIWTMIERDLRVRYKGSVLGVLWSMIVPIAQAFMYTILVRFFLNTGGHNQSAYIFCAIIPWLFFQTAVLDSSQSILSQLPLIKKVYFPREIPVIASTCASLIHLLISLLVFVIFRWGYMSLMYGWPGPPPLSILWLPFVIAILFLLTLGLSLFVAAMNVFYEDVKFIVTIGMQFLMYMTPIMYWSENLLYSNSIPAALRHPLYRLYLLNPIAWIVTAFKQMFIRRSTVPLPGQASLHYLMAPFNWHYGLAALLSSMVMCYFGYRTFTNAKWRFTERP